MELIRYPLQQLSDMMKEEAKEEYTKEEKENAAAVSFGKSLTTGYERIMEEGPERIATVLNYIGEKLEKGAVLFHCTAGKDRTGITAALIYLICGVSDVDIIADYQVTETYQIKNRVFDVMPTYLKPLLNSNAENMKKFLQAAEERNYLGLLRENGLEESAVTSIREHMIEN
jgi:protein-tyrosine phosphatase